MSTNTGSGAERSNTNDSTTSKTNTHPLNTGGEGSAGSKPNEANTGLNASETASELNAIMNVKTRDTQS